MKVGKRIIVSMMVLLLMLAGCSSETASDANTATNSPEGKKEGKKELRVALVTQPPTLDQPTTTATVTRDTARLMFETLLTTNSKYKAVPMLAESVETEDNQTYTFHLRKGVKFHNGKEMTAEDVVASMNRWLEKSSITGNIFKGATFEATNQYTVVLRLQQPSPLALDTMATAKMAAAIMPKEVVESAPPEGVTEYIGTGPYKFVEWKQDQYIHFTKFEDYRPVAAEPDGLAGRKEALVDDIYFYIVPDASTRMAGLQSGQYDFIYTVPFDNYEQLKNNPELYPVFDTYGEMILLYNKVEGLASNFKMRQAINAALDIDKIMLASYAHEDLYWLQPGYMTRVVSNWASNAGSEFYNQKDPEKAKQLLAEIGYNNEEFTIMTTRDYPQFYNAAVVIQEQLKAIGLNVKLEIYDWATLLDKQNDTGVWDAVVTGTSTVTTPSQLISLSETYAGGTHDPKIKELLQSIETSANYEEAKKLWDELQAYAWEHYLPITVLGGYNNLYGASKKVKAITTLSGPVYWNVIME
ncbi:ABC transporter substrate-binding protein [Brevibacillus marinus]|uniref:ABC transporter substrate-binding protein n=1 Tax=Brevibacillus marinus TaxID=2496837 RepID=UPI0013DFDAA4|nr:ABC transporter substrate-binding protein [Brevibacillus marinus]